MSRKQTTRGLYRGATAHGRKEGSAFERGARDCVRVPRAEYDALVRKGVLFELLRDLVEKESFNYVDKAPMQQIFAAGASRKGE